MSIFTRFSVVVLATVFLMLPCPAQETVIKVVPEYNLQDLRALAAQHNPTLKQAIQMIRGEEGKALHPTIEQRRWIPTTRLAAKVENLVAIGVVGVEKPLNLRTRISKEVLDSGRREAHDNDPWVKIHEVQVEAILLVAPFLLGNRLAARGQQAVAWQASPLASAWCHDTPAHQRPVVARSLPLF